MWSCEQQSFVHFGALQDRGAKLARIKSRPELVPLLRVCWQNRQEEYNCGHCEKCVRTRLQMKVLGIAEPEGLFSVPLTPGTVRRVRLPWDMQARYTWDFWRSIARDLRGLPELKPLERAVRRCMLKNRLLWPLRWVPDSVFDRLKGSPWAHRLKWRFRL